jgi:hypothetical protein
VHLVNIRLYIRPADGSKFGSAFSEKVNLADENNHSCFFLSGMRFQRDGFGFYMEFEVDDLWPQLKTDIDDVEVLRVVITDEVEFGQPKPAAYRIKEASATVRVKTMRPEGGPPYRAAIVSATGPDYQTALEIFNLVRSGEQTPTHLYTGSDNWP